MSSASSRAARAEKTCPRCGATYESAALFCAKDGSKLDSAGEDGPASDPYIGSVISGDIEILGVAGVGAMGRVYRAHQHGIDRDVAVKILHRELSGNSQLVQRFHREAKIASKLQHPHVVEVYLAGQLPDRALFIVMEYLDGMSLAEALSAAGGVFSPTRALSISLQICDAVGEGHSRGIVHRDLKPENVMLVRRNDVGEWVKVLDFGIAKVAVGEQSMQTAAGLVFGTARYISPEGAQGANVAPSGDVYSLATIIYQMLAGRTPFDAEPVGLLIKHIHEAPPPLTSWPRAKDIHPALAKVIMDNLAKQPATRAQSARAFAAQLAQAAKEASISISEVGTIARLSTVNLKERLSLEATLDDAAGFHAPAQLRPSAPTPTAQPASGPAAPPSPPALGLPALPPATAADREGRRNPLAIILLAFLLGAAIAAFVTHQLGRRLDTQHDNQVAKTRAALADSRYITPPGDCVRDLVSAGLKLWPNDVLLLQLRSTASMELVTRAMVAQNGGDVAGARDLARDATALDPADHSAALLLSQYDDELRAAGADASITTGKPRVLFDALPPTHAGKRVDLAAHIAVGNLGTQAKISDVRMTLHDHSATVDGIKIAVVPSGQGLYRATIAAPKAGNYDVVFEATLEGSNMRAIRELTVLP